MKNFGRRRRRDQEERNYPPYVTTDEERRRWDLAEGIARQIFGDIDEANVWMATRTIYQGPLPTDD